MSIVEEKVTEKEAIAGCREGGRRGKAESGNLPLGGQSGVRGFEGDVLSLLKSG
jgi:hypothetical protein